MSVYTQWSVKGSDEEGYRSVVDRHWTCDACKRDWHEHQEGAQAVSACGGGRKCECGEWVTSECGTWAPDDVLAAVWCTRQVGHPGRCSHLRGWDWPGPGEKVRRGER